MDILICIRYVLYDVDSAVGDAEFSMWILQSELCIEYF